MSLLHIAFDDTDSRKGRCTTHLAFQIASGLKKMGCGLADYPLLIRLNPNIPWKTRGNGAVCLRARVRDVGRVVDYVRQAVEEGSEIGSGANPGVAFLEGEVLPARLKDFSAFAMCDVSSRQQAEKVANGCGIRFWTFGNGQGLVGSLGAMGCALDGDHTFELIAYRTPENCGTPRIVDNDKIIEFSKETFPYTFNNYDQSHHRVLIAPHGPDPVFFGVRGESAEVVSSAMSKISPGEKLEGHMVFRSNQGTNMHMQNEIDLHAAKAYTAGYIQCRVKSKPYAMEGGHVIFSVERDGAEMPAAMYEPTGLANVAVALAPGDLIEIGVGVRKGTTLHPKILNIEYLLVKELAPVFDVTNPLCKICGKRMKSEGRNKGYQCERCKFRDQKGHKIMVEKERTIRPGLYVPTPKAHRHLTKPLHRYGMEKRRGEMDPKNVF
jgi:tRNA(Ile2)-agmatinylcytidine synthase